MFTVLMGGVVFVLSPSGEQDFNAQMPSDAQVGGTEPMALFRPLATYTVTEGRPQLPSTQSDENALTVQPRMTLCNEERRVTCVVDGDTIWLNGAKIRLADIDAPEIGEPQCDYEYSLGIRATHRLRDLLTQGSFEVRRLGDSDRDQYDRELRVLTREGQSIGDILVAEGLARTWAGRREPWR